MENELYTIKLCRADWERVICSLRNEAFWLSQQSESAQEKGSEDYADLCWQETAIYNSIADTIDFKLPE